MNFELVGKLIVIEDAQAVNASFRKREFVIEVENERNPEWNDCIKFQLTQDRCDLLDNFSVNSLVKVHFNIKGRKWEKDGKVSYFSNLEAWRIEAQESSTQANTPVSAPPYKEQEIPGVGNDADDLPF